MPGGDSPIQSTPPVHMCAALVSTGKGHLTLPVSFAARYAWHLLQRLHSCSVRVSQGRLALPATERRGACSQYACHRRSILHSQMRRNKTKGQHGIGVAAFRRCAPPNLLAAQVKCGKTPKTKGVPDSINSRSTTQRCCILSSRQKLLGAV
jgi:hypothetical protein